MTLILKTYVHYIRQTYQPKLKCKDGSSYFCKNKKYRPSETKKNLVISFQKFLIFHICVLICIYMFRRSIPLNFSFWILSHLSHNSGTQILISVFAFQTPISSFDPLDQTTKVLKLTSVKSICTIFNIESLETPQPEMGFWKERQFYQNMDLAQALSEESFLCIQF